MKKKIIVIVLSLVVIMGVGSTLAYLRSDAGSQNNNNITLADFKVDLITDMTSITMDPAYPMSDVEGLSNTGNKITFAIKNNGDILANYKVSLVDKDTVSTLKNSDVRYQLKRKVGDNEQETLSIKNLDLSGLIDEGNINVGVTISYELIMWQDYNSTANGVTFKKAIQVEGMQSSNLDKSGANFPELLDNMIPVYYEATNDTTGVWKKADSKNLDSNYKWFDYDNFMWANAVTVKESGIQTRDYYQNASAGTAIDMDDITTMWVWIPRYKYVIFNGNNETSTPQEIKVIFEHGKDKTGTVTCVDNIQTANDSSTSETCTDQTNGNIINYKSTYTHPAFTFGDDELTGFWMGKFEMATDDSLCNTSASAENCDKTNLNILVKPDQYSLRFSSDANLFANIRKMEVYNNIHGFINNQNATSWLSNDGILTGEIANDDNKFDIHMIKNMEWGAVAYLSQSQYGKYGNTLYNAENKEIYLNNHYEGDQYYSKTGHSCGKNTAISSNTTYQYNDLTVLAEGKGYSGAGASSTGNVYGIYDLNGAGIEQVMANIVNQSGEFFPRYSGFTSVLPKYYDVYSYSELNNTIASLSRMKFGDAVKEVYSSMGENMIAWYNDSVVLSQESYPFASRGQGSRGESNSGVYAYNRRTGTQTYYTTSRPTIAISREMPWKN